jgi:hypothetical protein
MTQDIIDADGRLSAVTRKTIGKTALGLQTNLTTFKDDKAWKLYWIRQPEDLALQILRNHDELGAWNVGGIESKSASTVRSFGTLKGELMKLIQLKQQQFNKNIV